MPDDHSIQFHVRLPRSLFTALEDYWRDRRLASRSDALRELLNQALGAWFAAESDRVLDERLRKREAKR